MLRFAVIACILRGTVVRRPGAHLRGNGTTQRHMQLDRAQLSVRGSERRELWLRRRSDARGHRRGHQWWLSPTVSRACGVICPARRVFFVGATRWFLFSVHQQ